MRPTLSEGELLKLVLVSFVLGLIIGVIYGFFDGIRIFRRTKAYYQKKPSAVIGDQILCFVEDVVFFLILTVLNVILFSAYGAGKFRYEGMALELLGFLLWHKTLGRQALKLVVAFKKRLFKACEWVLSKTLLAAVLKIKKKKEALEHDLKKKTLKEYTEREMKKLRGKLGYKENKENNKKRRKGRKKYEKQK